MNWDAILFSIGSIDITGSRLLIIIIAIVLILLVLKFIKTVLKVVLVAAIVILALVFFNIITPEQIQSTVDHFI